MTSAVAQVWALVRLRWTLLRSGGARAGVVLGGLLVLYLAQALARSAPLLSPEQLATAVELAPAAFLGFAALAVIAPLTTGGGNELLPPDQLAAYPIRPGTQFLGGLALAPLNLVWVLQLLALVTETAYLSQDGSGARAAVTTTAYALLVTAAGQALAWAVAGLRMTRLGRRMVAATAVGLLLGGVAVVHTGNGRGVLAHSPTRTVVHGVRAEPDELGRWAATTAGLLVLAALALAVGVLLCGWALRRSGDVTATRHLDARPRRAPRRSSLRALVAVDRASVWRAPALRRSGLVLAVLPGAGAAGAAVPWESLVMLPSLVAAGACLLFGVNAFSLDASGATWLASLPHRPRLVALAKTIVLTETVLAAAALAALAGSIRSPGSPTPAQLTAVVSSSLACTAVVVAAAMSRSVRRPHHAELRGPRDAVAPPGAMAVASLQLCVPVALVALVLTVASHGEAWLPPAVAVPVVLMAGLSLSRTLRRYDHVVHRARLVSVVSRG